MSVIKIGDQFKEYLFSDKRDSNISDVKIGIVKSIDMIEYQTVLIRFEKRDQLKVTTKLKINSIQKSGDFWIRI